MDILDQKLLFLKKLISLYLHNKVVQITLNNIYQFDATIPETK